MVKVASLGPHNNIWDTWGQDIFWDIMEYIKTFWVKVASLGPHNNIWDTWGQDIFWDTMEYIRTFWARARAGSK